MHGATTAYNLQKAHQESVLALECQVTEEERWACQAFVEAFKVAIGSYLPEVWGALLYLLQLPTSNMPLAALLGMSATTQFWVMVENTSTHRPHPKSARDTSTTNGNKCRCHSSDQDVLAPRQDEEETLEPGYPPKECLHQKRKEGRTVAKTLKEPHCEAFSKELAIVPVARQAYFKTHLPKFEQEGLDDLSSMFQQMATSANLLGNEIHEV